jgi:hypothetical protein
MEDDGSFENIMDERAAAMVLTSLSCSPVSPVFPMSVFQEKGVHPLTFPCPAYVATQRFASSGASPNGAASSTGSSGVWGMKGSSGTPSPPQFSLSQSAPLGPLFGPMHRDEGINSDSSEEDDFTPKRKRVCVPVDYLC